MADKRSERAIAARERAYEVMVDTWGARAEYGRGDIVCGSDLAEHYDLKHAVDMVVVRPFSDAEMEALNGRPMASTTQPIGTDGEIAQIGTTDSPNSEALREEIEQVQQQAATEPQAQASSSEVVTEPETEEKLADILSAEQRDAMIADGLITRAQITAASDADLDKIPNIGDATIKKIRAALA
jgi:hypothetical protein